MRKTIRIADGGTKLVYTSDEAPGYTRIRRGRGYTFYHPDGTVLTCPTEKKRLMSLAVPPAYKNVWICTKPNGHLQATGYDDRGRKQYRYHSAWHEHAADRKFGMLPAFAAALPSLRRGYRKALSEEELSRERVIAGIVLLVDRTGYRIGNARYEKQNKSYGLSSLLTRHLKKEGDHFTLHFRGKSGMEHEAEIEDPRLHQLIEELQDLPGQHLFRYEDDGGQWHDIGTIDVNDWIKAHSGGDFSAKQFRTWKASVLCAKALKAEPPPETKSALTRSINAAIKATALTLNHTPATCRKYYIHPALLRAFSEGLLFKIMNGKPPRLSKVTGTALLHPTERRVYKIITSSPPVSQPSPKQSSPS